MCEISTIKIFRVKNTKKGIQQLEQKLTNFIQTKICKDCCYSLDYTSNKRSVVAILDYSKIDHEKFKKMDMFEVVEKFRQLELSLEFPKCNCKLYNYSEKSYYEIDFEDNKVHEDSSEEIIQCQNCKLIIYQD